MRDPKRIDEILTVVEKIWKDNPDLRLCQLIGNVFPGAHDLYYVEDDLLKENLISSYLNNLN